MKKLYTLAFSVCMLTLASLNNSAFACYANFVHTNACTGDTVWFYGLDFSSVHVWDFGDSTSSNPNLAFDDTAYHVYTSPGTYYVAHFVNIGAEWAFETQEITVGSNCFGAAFHAGCEGSLYEVFQNTSVGSSLTYSWNFGEPSSGAADTSTTLSAYHTYAAAGNYTVTLIISDGTNTDSSVQSILVDTLCMSASVSYQWNPCAGDTTFFYYYFSGVTAVYWDFGDPSSGINNYSTLFSPVHVFATPGTYIGMVIYTNGTETDTLRVVTTVVDCSVWPGDANRDGYVTGEDFFAVGLYYGDTGVVRTNATTSFTGQQATNWQNAFNWAYMYLQDLVDKKHADCNGDGVVDGNDAAVIAQNFGMSHHPHNILSSMMITSASDPHLSVALPPVVSGSSSITADLIYGDSLVHIPVYGICAYLDYDPLQVDASSISVDFSNSFLDSVSIANLVTFSYNDLNTHTIVIVEVRTDHNGMNGFGTLAHITFNAATGYSGLLQLSISGNTKVMSNAVYAGGTSGNVENILKVITDDGSTQVSLGVPEYNAANAVSVYPSPAKDFVHLSVKNVSGNYTVRIIDATGRVLCEKYPVSNHQLLDIRDLAGGLYFLQVKGYGWESNTKMMVRD